MKALTCKITGTDYEDCECALCMKLKKSLELQHSPETAQADVALNDLLGAWFNAEERMPDYYKTVWAYDGTDVFLAKVVGRSCTPNRKIWRNLECNGVDDVWKVEQWQPVVKPQAP